MILAGHVAEAPQHYALHQAQRQELAEVVLRRSEWLEPGDRALLEQVFGRGGRARELAAMLQVSPRTIQRRIRQLVRRLTDPRVLVVMRRHGRWEQAIGLVAVAHYIRGLTFRQIAEERGLTLHDVRQQIQFVRGLIAAELAKER